PCCRYTSLFRAELSVEILLPLGLLLELVDRGEVDGAEPLDLALNRLEVLVPCSSRRLRRQLGQHLLELEARLVELLDDGLEPHLRLPGRKPHAVRRLTSRGDGLLRFVPTLLDLPKLRIEGLDGRARVGQLRLDGLPLVGKLRQRALVFRQRLDRCLELALKLVTPLQEVLLLREDPRKRRTGRLL